MNLRKRNLAIWTAVVLLLIGGGVALGIRIHRRQRITLKGAITRQDVDPNKQSPIADVQITAITGSTVTVAKSDQSGFFTVQLPRGFRRHQFVTLRFKHSNYESLDLSEPVGDQLYLIRMAPVTSAAPIAADHPGQVISNIRVRYSVKTTSEPPVGSAVKTFEVVNIANVPCKGHHPCSPDGKWKAALGSTSLDAGEGNEFRDARASCIAGPCPFARIESENLSRGGRTMNLTVRNWSDTVTFLLESEVVHPMVSDIVRDSYPVIFGRTLSFSLPASAEGPSVQAEVNGEAIVFPLGPDLFLSWAQCTEGTSKDQSHSYRCELKPGYRF